MAIDFTIETGDITAFAAEVVVLKYAQAFYGLDKVIAGQLSQAGVPAASLTPPPGDYRYLDTRGCLLSPQVLFVGVPPLTEFGYPQIREFAAAALTILAAEAPDTRRLATTVHGVGFGLDEVEAFLAQLAGFLEVLQRGAAPPALERISIVDRNAERVQRLRQILDQNLAGADYAVKLETGSGYRLAVGPRRMGHAGAIIEAARLIAPRAIAMAGSETELKAHVFVAMPFKKEMDDVFYFGIQQPVRELGFVCERVDQQAFVGDILDRVKQKIETAAIVIAELTGANPNVYLEVGYAWGKERPTILLARAEEELRFDVRGQRCLKYERIIDLKEALTRELTALRDEGLI